MIELHRSPFGLIYLDKEESVQMKQRLTGTYEPRKVKYIEGFLKGDMVFADIGANKGYFTLLAAHRCKEVIAIEPNKTNFHWLKKTIEENDLRNVTPINAAVSNVVGTAKLYYGIKSGHHTLFNNGNVSTEVETITANFPCDMMKIDVEGAELMVLQGILRAPEHLLMDIHPKHVSISDVYYELIELGYDISNYGNNEFIGRLK
jgi:FkbM family methyltransferase